MKGCFTFQYGGGGGVLFRWGGFILKRGGDPLGGHDSFFFEKNCRMEGGTPPHYGKPCFAERTLPFLVTPLSEANLKIYPQIGACKL